MARHVEPLDFLRNWKLNPRIFSDNVFSSTIIFARRIILLKRKMSDIIEREMTVAHLTSHSNIAVRCNIERGFPYTDTRQLDRSFTAAHQVTSLLICCINYTKNFTVIFLCETTEVAESWESSHERRQPSIWDNSWRSWSTSPTWIELDEGKSSSRDLDEDPAEVEA